MWGIWKEKQENIRTSGIIFMISGGEGGWTAEGFKLLTESPVGARLSSYINIH